jgi:hypothetical protein
LVFRGTLRRLAHRAGMMTYLWANRLLLKDFGGHAEELSRRLKDASEAAAHETGRPIRYLASSAVNKEAIAREIARADGIEHGLICILTAVEPCWSYEIVRNRAIKRLELQPRRRKCLHLYHYRIDPVLGFMNARLQTWFPFSIQVCLNGREWLARQMDGAGLRSVQRDNCFTWLEDAERAQQLMDRQVRAAWPELLDDIARSLNPLHAAMFRTCPVEYYWSTYQSEWASDVLFRAPAHLARLYPKLVHHGLTTFLSPDVMRFLGRKIPPDGRLPPTLKADVVSDLKTRPEGVRIKHRLGDNSIKMYDKQASVLRIETTINDAAGFLAFRTPRANPRHPRPGIACAGESPTSIAAPRCLRPPTTATSTPWPRSPTPPRSASWPRVCVNQSAATAVGSVRSTPTRPPMPSCSRQSAAASSPSTASATAICEPCSSTTKRRHPKNTAAAPPRCLASSPSCALTVSSARSRAPTATTSPPTAAPSSPRLSPRATPAPTHSPNSPLSKITVAREDFEG